MAGQAGGAHLTRLLRLWPGTRPAILGHVAELEEVASPPSEATNGRRFVAGAIA